MNSTEHNSTLTVSNNPKGSWTKAFLKAERFLGKKPFIAAFILAFALCSLILIFIKPFFEWDDDYYVRFLLKGIVLSFTPSEFNYLINPILGFVLKNLYGFFPTIEWYGSFSILAQFLSLWAILASFNLGTNRCFKSLLFVLGFAVLEVKFLTELQWTTVATSAAIGAFLLLTATMKRKNSRFLKPALVFAFILIVISVLVRPDSLWLICVAGIPGFIYLFRNRGQLPHRREIILFFVFTVIVSVALAAIYNYCYFQDDAWWNSLNLFKQHNELFDFRNPFYNKNTEPLFSSLGWTANDLKLFKYDYFLDPNTYSLEKLQILNNYFPKFDFNKSAQDTFAIMFANLYFQMAVIFIACALFFLREGALYFILFDIVWTAVLLCFCHWYLKIPPRIFLPCLFLLGNLAIFLASPRTKRPFNQWKIVPLLIVFVFACKALGMANSAHLYQNSLEQDLKASVKSLNPQDDEVFVTWGDAFPYAKNGAFDDDTFLDHFHAISLDWFQRSPITQDMMFHYGLKNVFKDLVDNPKAFLICSSDELYFYNLYMNEKFGIDTRFQPYFTSAQFTVYRVWSVQKIKTTGSKNKNN